MERGAEESPREMDVVKGSPKPSATTYSLTKDPKHTHPPLSSNLLDSQTPTNPNPNLCPAKERENGGRNGGSKCAKKDFGARGVAAGRVAKTKDKRLRKQNRVKVAAAIKSIRTRGGDQSRVLDRKDINSEGHIIIDLSQVSALRSSVSRLSVSTKGMQDDPGDQVEEGGKGEVNLESRQETLMSQRPEMTDTGDMTIEGEAQAQFQYINYDEVEGRRGNTNTSMLVEGMLEEGTWSEEEEAEHGAEDE